TLNRETGAKGEESRNQGTGYGVRCLPLPIHPSPFLIRGYGLGGSGDWELRKYHFIEIMKSTQ
ncbi:hypothetical protein OAK70_04290, partial [Akkermansiaceae bacterium]|nr:hypothetical protein [Akkermansiaceae bacterium]